MIDWCHIDGDRVLYLYLRERARLSSVPSSQGFDDDGRMPSLRPSPEWETLLLLVRGVPPLAIETLSLRIIGSAGTTIDGGLYDEQVAIGLTHRQIARITGATTQATRRLIRDAQNAVAENLATMRGRSR